MEVPDKFQFFTRTCCVCLKLFPKANDLTILTRKTIDSLQECFSIQYKTTEMLKICVVCAEAIVNYEKFRTSTRNHAILVNQILSGSLNDSTVIFPDTSMKNEDFVIKDERENGDDAHAFDSIKLEDIQTELKNDQKPKTKGKRKTNGKKPFPCTLCERTFKLRCSLGRHMRIHSNKTPKTFGCGFCEEVFPTIFDRSQHRKQNHKLDKVCHICGELYGNYGKKRHHMLLHEDETGEDGEIKREKPDGSVLDPKGNDTANKFECTICLKMYKTRYVLKTHVKEIHASQKYVQCQICDKRLKFINYKAHYKVIHLKRSKFSCNVCGKVFNAGCHLRSHMRSHTNERPFACDLCDKTYRTRKVLSDHVKTHTGERPFGCDLCPFKFMRRWDMIMHRRTHTGQKDYACSVCLQRFTQGSTLMNHMKRHKRDGDVSKRK